LWGQVGFRIGQAVQVVQGIEKEMRVDLRFQVQDLSFLAALQLFTAFLFFLRLMLIHSKQGGDKQDNHVHNKSGQIGSSAWF
jgi:hypothetical protein